MRSEQEMMALILRVAEEDKRIRAVYMNGSRTNENAPRDIFQDYDIVYVVTETESFLADEKWVAHFGELLIMQEPDKMDSMVGKEVDLTRTYAYLMLFKDGNRIDLRLQTNEAMIEEFEKDKLTVILLDKDDCLPVIHDPTDEDYHVQRPTEALFLSSCNEFWWCLQNVAKGIWRDEIPYAKRMFEEVVRVPLDSMVSWSIGIKWDFNISVGKMGKYFKRYLPENEWEMYERTYSGSDVDPFWESIFVACELFRILAKKVAEHFSWNYPRAEDENITSYLKQVRNLPSYAKEVF